MSGYLCLKGCSNDDGSVRYEPGDTVPEDAFSKEIVDRWLVKGVLERPVPKKKRMKKEASDGNR